MPPLASSVARRTPRPWLVACLSVWACTNRHVESDTDADTTGTTGGADPVVTGSGSGGSLPASAGEEATTAAPAEPCGNGELDPGEGCDDGNATPGDGCLPDCTFGTGEALAAVWSGPQWPRILAVLAGADALVLGGGAWDTPEQFALVPLAPGGPTPWSHVGVNGRFISALAADGDIIAVGTDRSVVPARRWLSRLAATGETRWTRDLNSVQREPLQVLVAPNGDIVVREELAGIHVFDREGALRWTHVAVQGQPSSLEYDHVAVSAQGTIHAIGLQSGNLVGDALDPEGNLVRRRELASPRQLATPLTVPTPDDGLLVVMSQRLPADPDPLRIGALVRFDAAGELLWSRDDESLAASIVTPLDVVPMPGGGVFVAWRTAGDDSASFSIARYDPAGALLYSRGTSDMIQDLALGPDGLVYSLEWAEFDPHAAVVPYRP